MRRRRAEDALSGSQGSASEIPYDTETDEFSGSAGCTAVGAGDRRQHAPRASSRGGGWGTGLGAEPGRSGQRPVADRARGGRVLGGLDRRRRRRARAVPPRGHPERGGAGVGGGSRRLVPGDVQLDPCGPCTTMPCGPPEYHRPLVETRTWRSTGASPRRRLAAPRPGAAWWIQDYHLQLVPRMLRELRPDISSGFFLHIPFPADRTVSCACRGGGGYWRGSSGLT